MKIARMSVHGLTRTVFQHLDGLWYDTAVVLSRPDDYLENWEENLRLLQAFNPQGQDSVIVEEAEFAIPFQPKTFRDFYAFEEHVKTCRAKRGLAVDPAWYEIPVFYFSNPYAMVAAGAAVHAPLSSEELDFELELGLVIGKAGRNISVQDAWDHVAGFCIINDFSARDLQRQEMSLQLGPAKGKDFATAIGPYFVSKDELIAHKTERGNLKLAMSAYLNGKRISSGHAESMYHSWPEIIAHASRDVELQVGDLLGSGTVGTGCILELGTAVTGAYLQVGDCIRLEIDGLGVLENHICERPQ